jgi:hypothetical protein
MSQPPSPPTPSPLSPDYPSNPTPLQQTLIGFQACSEAVIAASTYTNLAQTWAGLTYGDWLIWYCFQQASSEAQQRTLCGQLLPLLSPWIVSGNMPNVLSGAQALLTGLESFVSGSLDRKGLAQQAASYEAAVFPGGGRNPPPTITPLETSIVKALVKFAVASSNTDLVQSATAGAVCGYYMATTLVRMGAAADITTAQSQLAALVRGVVPAPT